MSLKFALIFANSADPDELPPCETLHLKCLCTGIKNGKGDSPEHPAQSTL